MIDVGICFKNDVKPMLTAPHPRSLSLFLPPNIYLEPVQIVTDALVDVLAFACLADRPKPKCINLDRMDWSRLSG